MNRIKEFRSALNIGLSQLAKETGISWEFLYQIERNESIPNVSKAIAIANRLGVSVEKLFPSDNTPPEDIDYLDTLTAIFEIYGIRRVLFNLNDEQLFALHGWVQDECYEETA